MKKVVLQEIIFPVHEICREEELYFYKRDAVYIEDRKEIEIKRGGYLDLGTYFNGFSIMKWGKYTYADQYSVLLNVKGGIRVGVYQSHLCDFAIVKETLIEKEVFTHKGREQIEIALGGIDSSGIITVKIQALTDNVYFYGGAFQAEIEEKNISEVSIAIVCCTYKREKYAYRIVKNVTGDHKNSSNIKLFLVDNGNTIKKDLVESFKVKLIKGKNNGGSGGFARGMIEILQSENKFTHCVLIDDDITLDVRILARLCSLLSILKKEYKNYFIGGAMFRAEFPSIQMEAGTHWNDGSLKGRKINLDMRKSENCLLNEYEEENDCNGWYFCVIPMEYIRMDNLPLPLFVCYDDIEYSLRNHARFIYLNGINIWHESFEGKYSTSRIYYMFRNLLIVKSVIGSSFSQKEFLKLLKKTVEKEINMYRYLNAKIIIRAAEDFLNGPGWLMSIKSEKLNEDIINNGYRLENVHTLDFPLDYEKYRFWKTIKDYNKIHKWIRKLTRNGLYLPDNREAILSLYDIREAQLYRVTKALNFSPLTERGFVTEKDRKLADTIIRDMKKCKKRIKKEYRKIVAEYKKHYKEMTGYSFWNEYTK